MSTALRNLKFLQRRHKLSGFDVDYLFKLSSENLAWLESFARRYYNGEGETNPVHKQEANHRRYMAKSADAMSRSSGLLDEHTANGIGDLSPETLLILKETDPHPPRRLRSSRRRPDEAVKKET